MIKEVKGIVAMQIEDTIYLHPGLKDFPKLREFCIDHEKEHLKVDKFWQHAANDMKSQLMFFKFIKFFIKYPDSLRHFLPINNVDGRWTWCLHDIIVYSLLSITTITTLMYLWRIL